MMVRIFRRGWLPLLLLIEGVCRGHNSHIITIYLDHLQVAARALNN